MAQQDVIPTTELRAWRLRQDPPLSQESITKELGINLNAWRAYEYGDKKPPRRVLKALELWETVRSLRATAVASPPSPDPDARS